MRGFQEQRVKYFKTILEAIEAERGIKREKLEALLQVELGFRPEKAREYIDTLLKAEKIVEKDGVLYVKGNS